MSYLQDSTTGKRSRDYRDRDSQDQGLNEEVRTAFRRLNGASHVPGHNIVQAHRPLPINPAEQRIGIMSHAASLNNRNRQLLNQNQKLLAEKEELRRDKNRCNSHLTALEGTVRRLRRENNEILRENDELREMIRQLNAEPDLIRRLQSDISRLRVELAVGHAGQVNNAMQNLNLNFH